jgi:hypothetical protein
MVAMRGVGPIDVAFGPSPAQAAVSVASDGSRRAGGRPRRMVHLGGDGFRPSRAVSTRIGECET